MPRLPSILTGSVESIKATLDQWQSILNTHLPRDAEPLLPPRNARTEKPATNTIRLRWDPGSIHTEGHDITYSEQADFSQSQSHRVQGRDALYFDLVVQNTNKRYFRIRSFKGSKLSRWSNIVVGLADISTPAGTVSGNPGTVTFTPAVGSYGTIAFTNFVLTGKADLLHVDVWFVDEPRQRYLWGQIASDMDATTDPVSLTVAVTRKATNYDPPVGESPTYDLWAVGDYVVFDDSRQDSDTAGHATWRRYEVARIKTVTGDQTAAAGENYSLTIEFEARGSLGSRKQQHDAVTRMYRLKKRHFVLGTKDNLGNDKIINEEEFPLANATVVSMQLAVSDVGFLGTYSTVYCQPLAYPYPGIGGELNPAPGFRTCQGAEYLMHLDGLLVAGQSLPKWSWIAEDAGIRNAVVTIAVAPAGQTAVYDGVLYSFTNISLVAYILLIEQFRRGGTQGSRRVAVLEQLGIRENEYQSFNPSDIPDFRRTPYGLKWPAQRYPVIGTVDDLYDLSVGTLRTNVLPFTATGEFLDMQEACEMDLVVARVGSAQPGSGSSLVGILMT